MKNQTQKINNKKETIVFILRSCGKLAGTERVLLDWCKFIDGQNANLLISARKGEFWDILKEEVPHVNFIDCPFDDGIKGFKNFVRSLLFFKKLNAAKVVWLFTGLMCFTFSEVFASWIVTRGNVYFSHHNFIKPLKQTKSKMWFGLFPGIGLWRIKKKLHVYMTHMLAKKILAVSNPIKESLESDYKIPPNKIVIANSGVDIDFFYPNSEAKKDLRREFNIADSIKIFIAINRFSKEKRIDRLLGVFLLLLKKRHNDIYLFIAGEGPLKSYYEYKVGQNGLLSKCVKFIGFRKDINRFIQGADFLLLSSDSEGESCVIKEAMACGVIPITTDAFGNRGISKNIIISKRNVFDFYNKIEFVLSIQEEEKLRIRNQLTDEIKKNYSLKESCINSLKTFCLR